MLFFVAASLPMITSHLFKQYQYKCCHANSAVSESASSAGRPANETGQWIRRHYMATIRELLWNALNRVRIPCAVSSMLEAAWAELRDVDVKL